MSNKGKENNSISLEQVVCPVCGLYNDGIFTFCESCGTRLPKDAASTTDTWVNPQIVHERYHDEEMSEDNMSTKAKEKTDKWFRILVMMMLLVGGAFYFDLPMHVINFASGDDEPVIEQQEETVSTYEEPINESEEPENLVVDGSAIEILSSDWDHDSSRKVNGRYVVDAILYVRNNGDWPLVRIKFQVPELDKTYEAIGYVPSGKKGVMVATLDMIKRHDKPLNEGYAIEEGYTNIELGNYNPPSGRIIQRHGENNDYYDVMIDNENNLDVSQSAMVVAVLIKSGKIKESDATGKISSNIPGGVDGWIQKDAFYDPHFYHYEGNEDKYRLFIIDRNLLLGE